MPISSFLGQKMCHNVLNARTWNMTSFDTEFWKLSINKTLLCLVGAQEVDARNRIIQESL
jgi:hypothetical protein